ncbi:DUF1549 domain-containing protein [Blastopirellula sp. JC732]|uniref:DUF1549 domain-containing protein n=1 Tax=Blastopirellula sediminis TaxID=2894196 RepID=A0A9X1MHV9_9BACT|nr:DUF1549 domain-containing protein [Blastopirellula sediminis]MCC9607799.1 DUF1549 domain-containing protein [Blastopirellula sediminis]MCC9627408.1 DUF1549 domain-containing protein [Blastopirellula sediminis]
MNAPKHYAAFFCSLAFLISTGFVRAEEISKEQAAFFENDIRPLLIKRCFECHSDESEKGGLRLDSRGAILSGGESGAAIEPHKPEESLLIEAINYESFEMPPAGKMPDNEIALLTKWVKMGAPWPGGNDAPIRTTAKDKITEEDRHYWAFQPLASVNPPQIDEERWNRNPIDRFIRQQQLAKGITPNAKADKLTLLRRVCFDLTGLPPTPEQTEKFMADQSPNAYETLVDSLLDSQHFGERMATHWLDLVRYAESDGYRQDAYRPYAWRYRDYVINSFNHDKPYDQFVLEQLAGDEVAPDNPEAIVATGFLRHWIYEYNQRDVRTQWQIILNDITDTTSDVFLGVGMGCAKCHDHKFDPLLQRDYFQLQAFFTPILPRNDVPAVTPDELAKYNAALTKWEEDTREIRAKIDEMEAKPIAGAIKKQTEMFPDDIQVMMNKPPAERTPYEHQIVEMAYEQVNMEISRRREQVGDDAKKEEYKKLKEELAKFPKPAGLPTIYSVSDVGPQSPPTFITGKERLGEISPDFLTVLDASPVSIESSLKSTGRRSELARWITSDNNALASRVIANRLWQWCFSRGLVETPNDFGNLGTPPSHPELLDWMSQEFIDQGRSMKSMIRMLVTSETYQLASTRMPESDKLDLENKTYWRNQVRRMSAEQVRDAMLAAAGKLDRTTGGSSVSGTTPRRSVYMKVIRNTREPLMDAFDFPERFSSAATRNTTTTPTQSLLLINGDFPLQQATAMTAAIRKAGKSSEERIRAAYMLAYSRQPTTAELEGAQEFIQEQLAITRENSAKEKPLAIAKFKSVDKQGVHLKPDAEVSQLSASLQDFTGASFTVESIVQLDSLYEDASVRTIASQWNGGNSQPGWNFGVTSKKSRYTPRNLIMQLVGANSLDQTVYEVLPSGIHLELGRPYYACLQYARDDSGAAEVRFFVQDLSEENAPLQTAVVKTEIIAGLRNEYPLVIGGRTGTKSCSFDGLVAEVRAVPAVLSEDQLLIQNSGDVAEVVGHWKFEKPTGSLRSLEGGVDLVSGDAAVSSDNAAWVDFCHILLNSNEFLYVP